MRVQAGASNTDRFEATEDLVDQLFYTSEGRANPYPLYHQSRQIAPVHRTKLGMWLLSRYDDCWAAMRDPRLGKDYAPQIEQRFGPDWRKHPSLTAGEHSMLNTSGPEHTRLRKLVTKSFTPRMVEVERELAEAQRLAVKVNALGLVPEVHSERAPHARACP